jgi:hypothetical protein
MKESTVEGKIGVVLITLAVFLVALDIIYVRINSPHIAIESNFTPGLNATWAEVYSIYKPNSTSSVVDALGMVLVHSFSGGLNYTTAPPIDLAGVDFAITQNLSTRHFRYSQLNITYIRAVAGHKNGILKPGEIAYAQIRSDAPFAPGSAMIELKFKNALTTRVNFTVPKNPPSSELMIWPQ